VARTGEISGPNRRVVEVMNFLAAHPTDAFTLTEIASRLGLSNGSAHRVLTTLTESHYLSRHPKRKTYSLGMALLAIGQAALSKRRDIEIARQEVIRLAADLGTQCVATTIANGELVIVACAGTPRTSEPINQIGERRPFIPPLGITSAAWADLGEQREYLARAPAAFSDKAKQRLHEAMHVIRERGYSISGSGPAIRALRQLTSLPVGYQTNESYWAGLRQLLTDLSESEIQLLDLDEVKPEGVSYINAPVFSPSGEVVLELSLNGLTPELGKADLARHIECLLAAAAAVTSGTLSDSASLPPGRHHPSSAPGASVQADAVAGSAT
jgi:DNA-binding IclR family transcriptional regulator